MAIRNRITISVLRRLASILKLEVVGDVALEEHLESRSSANTFEDELHTEAGLSCISTVDPTKGLDLDGRGAKNSVLSSYIDLGLEPSTKTALSEVYHAVSPVLTEFRDAEVRSAGDRSIGIIMVSDVMTEEGRLLLDARDGGTSSGARGVREDLDLSADDGVTIVHGGELCKVRDVTKLEGESGVGIVHSTCNGTSGEQKIILILSEVGSIDNETVGDNHIAMPLDSEIARPVGLGGSLDTCSPNAPTRCATFDTTT